MIGDFTLRTAGDGFVVDEWQEVAIVTGRVNGVPDVV
jgi:hypothetical protein